MPKYSDLATYSHLFYRLLEPTFLLSWEELSIVEINGSCEAFLGAPAEKILGTPLIQWVRPEQRTNCEKFLRIAKRRYFPYQFEVDFTCFEKEQPIIRMTQTAACELSLQTGDQIIQVIVKDISKQVQAERSAAEYLEQLKAVNQKLTELSNTDGLTGLTNVRQFKNQLTAEHARSSRYQTPYSIVFIDIDHFKHYNDNNGHPAGDALLQGFAQILKTTVRLSDLPARYGGEEFVVLCPAVTAYQAIVLAERIKTNITKHPFAHSATQPLGLISASIGIASFPEHGSTPEAVLEKADQALYLSKKNGRNRVTIATA